MPLFEYQCKKCQNEFEELVSPTQVESFTPQCPACASRSVTKKLSTIAKTNMSDTSSCASGTCNIPNLPCANGMCGLS